MRHIFSLITGSLLLLLLFTGCRNIQEVQCTGVTGFRVNKINTEGIDGNILLSIRNPNSFGFSIRKSEFDVTYSGVYIGKARLTKRVRIRPRAEEVYSFHIANDFKNVRLNEVIRLLSGGTFKNSLELKGDLRIGKLLIRKKIPVHLKEKISLN
jgi:LEA14-like dessication related protein